ncbi:MAG: tetratricopeptide repeat protein [Mariprofundaceae bacterium]
MLAASSGPPNHAVSGESRSAPRPGNWRGVDAGLAAAKAAFHAGKLEVCEAVLREVLEFAPAEARAWAWLGKVLEVGGREGEAHDCYARARALLVRAGKRRTASPPASIGLARLLWRQGEKDAARAMLAVLLVRDPEDPRLKALKEDWSLGA